ncbi:hypothetical protein HMPREF3213_03953 [Heyndrickxia coagulans]|uniref:Uncharacterized protein n=1 Tax=Heyndrickxia coagulans TaxID=1398 RepID=A0A133K9I4_HEYCO|nr:hypothetical protein HMPREF3213_03953 [Heyndrickxia coagulans]
MRYRFFTAPIKKARALLCPGLPFLKMSSRAAYFPCETSGRKSRFKLPYGK